MKHSSQAFLYISPMNTIDRIEKLLIEKGVPRRKVKRALADVCDVSYQAVRDWFTGSTQKISPDYIALIAKEWKSTTDYLITGDTSTLKDPTKDAEDSINKLPLDAQLELYEKLGRVIHEKLKEKQNQG